VVTRRPLGGTDRAFRAPAPSRDATDQDAPASLPIITCTPDGLGPKLGVSKNRSLAALARGDRSRCLY